MKSIMTMRTTDRSKKLMRRMNFKPKQTSLEGASQRLRSPHSLCF